MAARGMPDWPWTGIETDALPQAERLLLDAIRRWHDVARAGAPPLPALRLLLAAMDAARAAQPLDGLLRQVPAIGFGCGLCPRVTRTEAALLLLCGLAQRGAPSEALAAALRLMPLHTAQAALPAAMLACLELRTAGLLLRHPLRDALRSPAPPRG